MSRKRLVQSPKMLGVVVYKQNFHFLGLGFGDQLVYQIYDRRQDCQQRYHHRNKTFLVFVFHGPISFYSHKRYIFKRDF